jgi:hypothetical protein
MLPSASKSHYQQFQRSVEELQTTLAHAPALKTAIAALQTLFQTQIWNADRQTLEPKLEQQIHSINVEIDKQLRLLTMDGFFLQSARQENTIEQRKQQMRDRLALLLRYCDGVLSK